MRKIESFMRKAIEKYDLIQNGDKIAVGLSGGKDSLALLVGLSKLKSYLKINFELIAIIVDNGNPENKFENLESFCRKYNVPLHIYKSNIYQVVFEIRKEKNPCALCAKMRRGILCTYAKELGANKVALGHHADDLIETFFMSLFYEGRLSTFSPKSHLDKTNITIIRPLLLCYETDIINATKHFPILKNSCPVDGTTKREEMKNFVKTAIKENKVKKDVLFKAIISPDRYNLFK